MRKTIFLLAFLLMGIAVLGQTTFHKKFQGGILLGITPLVNGGLLGVGFQSQFFAPNEGLLVRFNEFGSPIWQKRYPNLNFIRNSLEVSDGYLIVGDSITTSGPLPRPRYTVISKLSISGSVSWSKRIGFSIKQSSLSHVIDTPNGFLISGVHSEVDLSAQNGVFLSSLDDHGNPLWSKTYFSTNPNYIGRFSAQLVQGDTVYACGHIQGNGCFVRVNLQTGELIGWSSFGGIFWEVFNSLQPTQDGNFILAGLTRSTTGSEEERPWVVKVNRLGQIIWSKTYNILGVSLSSQVLDAEDGGYILSMGVEEGLSNYYSVLAKIDESGNLLWAYNYSNGENSGLYEIRRTADGGFVALGDGMLKVDKFGRVANGCCPTPIVFQVEDYLPPYQNPVMIEEDWEQGSPYSIQTIPDSSFNVSDYCNVAITSIVEQVQVCQGDSIQLNGVYYQAPYTLMDTVQSLDGGCDTVFVYNLVQIPQPFRVESISFCPGNSVTIQGVNYTEPDTIYQILPAVAGCDTLLVTFLKWKPLPIKYQTTTFCPGDTVLVDGVGYLYPAVLPNPDTLPGSANGCDTLLYQQLAYPDEPSSVSINCPVDLVVSSAAATPLVVHYTMPTASSDCSCPEPSFFLQEGLPSGALFSVGPTQVCYSAYDICGDYKTCCFKVTVVEDDPCDVKETACLRYELLGIANDDNQDKTVRLRVTNLCSSPLVYTAIQTPNAVEALAPPPNSIYISMFDREYSVRNPNFSPFRSVRFKALGLGIANGQSDVFEYTLPAQTTPVFFKVMSKLSSGAFYESTLNTFGCGVVGNREANQASNESGDLHGIRVYPNPTSGEFFVEVTGMEACGVQLRLLSTQGMELLRTTFPASENVTPFPLPTNMNNGVYFMEMKSECGTTQTVRLVLNR